MSSNFDFDDSVRADLDHMRDHKRYRGTALAYVIAGTCGAIVFAFISVALA